MIHKLKDPTFIEKARKVYTTIAITVLCSLMTGAFFKMGDFAVKSYHHWDTQDQKTDSISKLVIANAKILTDFINNDIYEKGAIHQELAAHKDEIIFNRDQIITLTDALGSMNKTIYLMQKNRATGMR